MVVSPPDFEEIRCYTDDEVAGVVGRLIRSKDLPYILLALRFPVFRNMPLVARLFAPLVRSYLRRKTRAMRTVYDLQVGMLRPYLIETLERSCASWQCSGMEGLELGRPYLFISNHRDIVFDPMLLNFSMHENGYPTLRLAVGDNLMTKSYESDLMRLNKGIKVRRSFSNSREALTWHKHFASYIKHSIVNDRCSLWIAQGNGRTKDGNDKTDTGLLKMLSLPLRDEPDVSFSAYMNTLSIVPVSISYEYDPGAALKAQEVCAQHSGKKYVKDEGEDSHSIAMGVLGWKGRIHIHYGQPLKGEYHTPTEIVQALDRSIVGDYVLFPSNYFAFQQLHGYYPQGDYGFPARPFDEHEVRAEHAEFTRHLKRVAPRYREYVLRMYANPLANKMALCAAD